MSKKAESVWIVLAGIVLLGTGILIGYLELNILASIFISIFIFFILKRLYQNALYRLDLIEELKDYTYKCDEIGRVLPKEIDYREALLILTPEDIKSVQKHVEKIKEDFALKLCRKTSLESIILVIQFDTIGSPFGKVQCVAVSERSDTCFNLITKPAGDYLILLLGEKVPDTFNQGLFQNVESIEINGFIPPSTMNPLRY